MKLNKIFLLLLIVILSMSLIACSVDKHIEDELTDAEIITIAKSNLDIIYTDSNDSSSSVTSMLVLPSQDGEVSILWTSNNSAVISNTGVVTRQDLAVEVKLTATLKLNNSVDIKEFNVVVKEKPAPPVDYGRVTIDDLTIYLNSNFITTSARIVPKFSKEEMKEDLTYSVISEHKDMISIDELGNVTAQIIAEGTVRVKAVSENFSTEFDVELVYHNYADTTSLMYELFNTARFNVVDSRNKLKDLDLSEYTVIIGDSFTADRFIGEFLTEFGKDKFIINAGISATSSYHWEAIFNHVIGNKAPKNIVLNIGTNNFYDVNDSVHNTVLSIQRLLNYMHMKYPTTQIYYFGISQRTNTTYAKQVTDANKMLKDYFNAYDFLTFVDAGLLSGDLSDGIHPNLAGYTKMFNALQSTDIQIVHKS